MNLVAQRLEESAEQPLAWGARDDGKPRSKRQLLGGKLRARRALASKG